MKAQHGENKPWREVPSQRWASPNHSSGICVARQFSKGHKIQVRRQFSSSQATHLSLLN